MYDDQATQTATLGCCPAPGLEASLGGSAPLHGLAGLIAQCHAEVCVIAILNRSGTLVTELAHRDAELEQPARELFLGEHAEARLAMLHGVIASGAPSVLPGEAVWTAGPAPDATAELLASHARGASWVAVPLKCGGEVIGGMLLLYLDLEPEQAWSAIDGAVKFGEQLGDFVGHSRLCSDERSAVRTRDEMLGLVAHDLRNPLNLIKMSAELMLEQVPPEDTFFHRWLGAIILAGERMNQVVGDLLEVTRLEAGSPAIRPAALRLDTLLHDAIDLHQLNAEQKGIRLELEDAPPDVYVRVDLDDMRRVFTNLVDNALRFTPAGGTVLVRADRDGADIRIEVADTGSGIDPEHLPRIFDRFYQARASHRAGAGLGLAIAKGIVEAHGGRIWATSTPGAGTTFYFTVPVTEAP